MNDGYPTKSPRTRASALAQLTGAATLALGALLYGNGSSQLQTLAPGAAGTVLVSQGAAAPVWTNIYAQANVWTAAQTIDVGTGALPAPLPIVGVRLSAADGVGPAITADSFGATGFVIAGRAIGGTRAAQSATTGDRSLVGMLGYGFSTAPTASPSGRFDILADGLWSGTNTGTWFRWFGTLNGNTSGAEWMRLQNGNLGIGVTPTAGNGLLQLASGTTKANGIAVGNWNLWRVGDTDFNLAPTNGVDGYVRIVRSTGETLAMGAASGVCIVRAASAHPLWIGANGGTNLHVKNNGQVRFVPLSADPAGAETGDVYYNSTTNKLRVYNGAWVDLH